MDPVLVPMAFHYMSEVDWSSSGGPNDFLSYYFATGTVKNYVVKRIAPVKRQNVDDGFLVSESTPAVDVN